ncbi:SLAM family member 5-like isoform X2 [Carassius gibelio]|uniref:SLAM family member 5-like isoform X2 n=1 Tax=Carassius gibelio TaxID=101364 RepID=UPI0022796AAF|nr:SLAM family member 5-like isoform X2 [Carassius gibelio]
MKKMSLKLVLFCLCFWRPDGGFVARGMRLISVNEGDSVTLFSNLTEMKDDDWIQWMFRSGKEHTLIAEINVTDDRITVYDDVLDGRFRNRLKLNNQTGSLTITNITTEDAGQYELLTNHVRSRFSLTVYARLPVPVISRVSSECSSCSVVCSAADVRNVTLSWYKGNSLLTSFRVYGLSSDISLRLWVENQDKNTYSCVLNNPISHQTVHVNITQLCHTCDDSVKL